MSENLGRLTSAGIPIKWDGKDYILGNFSFRDRGLIENALIREKRRRKIQVIIDLQDVLPPAEYERRFGEARKEAELLGTISEEEVEAYLLTNDGITMLLWVLFEDRYPGEFTRDKIGEMLGKGAVGEDELVAILIAIRDAIGIGPAGNSIGHNHPKLPQAPKTKKRRRRSRSRSKNRKR